MYYLLNNSNTVVTENDTVTGPTQKFTGWINRGYSGELVFMFYITFHTFYICAICITECRFMLSKFNNDPSLVSDGLGKYF